MTSTVCVLLGLATVTENTVATIDPPIRTPAMRLRAARNVVRMCMIEGG